MFSEEQFHSGGQHHYLSLEHRANMELFAKGSCFESIEDSGPIDVCMQD